MKLSTVFAAAALAAFLGASIAPTAHANVFDKAKKGLQKAGKGIKDTAAKVGKGIKDTAAKVGKGIKDLGSKALDFIKKAKDKIIAKMKSFGGKLIDKVKALVGNLVAKVIETATNMIGFTVPDVKGVIDAKSGKVDRTKVRQTVLRRLLAQFVQPMLSEKVYEALGLAWDTVKPAIDTGVSAIITALGSIPVAGGAISGAVHAAYSWGSSALATLAKNTVVKWVSEFVSKKLVGALTSMFLSKVAAPGAVKALDFLGGKVPAVKSAIEKLFSRAYDFFENWVKLPTAKCTVSGS